MRKYAGPIGMFCLFEAIAVTLWLAKDNLFYLFNFTYIGGSLALGCCCIFDGGNTRGTSCSSW